MSKDNNKPENKEASPQDLQRLIAQHLMQQKMGQKPQGSKLMALGSWGLKKAEKSVRFIDSFINFVIRKDDPDRNDVMRTARYPILFGGWVMFLFVMIGGTWSAIAPLDSAQTAIGIVQSSSFKQLVQHSYGGVVKRIFVAKGQYVTLGQPLIEIDDTRPAAEYRTSLEAYRTLLANEARIIAERDQKENIEFDEFLTKEAYKPEVKKILDTQVALLNSRREVYGSKLKNIKSSIEQAKKKGESLESIKEANQANVKFLTDRVAAYKKLSKDGYLQKSALQDVETKLVGARSELARVENDIINNVQDINKLDTEYLSVNNEYLNRTVEELKQTQVQLADSKKNYLITKDQLNRLLVRSPVEGIVNDLFVNTIGGLAPNNQPIAEISPYKDNMFIEAKIPQKNIENVRVGLKTKLRFSAFKARTTPVFTGKIVSISNDVIQDRQAAAQMAAQNPMAGGDDAFYVAKIEIDMDEFNKFAGKAKHIRLHPGMKAEIQIVTGTRTLLRYLLDPVTDNMFKAFNEK